MAGRRGGSCMEGGMADRKGCMVGTEGCVLYGGRHG